MESEPEGSGLLLLHAPHMGKNTDKHGTEKAIAAGPHDSSSDGNPVPPVAVLKTEAAKQEQGTATEHQSQVQHTEDGQETAFERGFSRAVDAIGMPATALAEADEEGGLARETELASGAITVEDENGIEEEARSYHPSRTTEVATLVYASDASPSQHRRDEGGDAEDRVQHKLTNKLPYIERGMLLNW